MKQAANTVMMIRPVDFSFNWETAASNAFQNAAHGFDTDTIKKNAAKEFDDFVNLLQQNGVDVIVFNDTPEPATPDSIFPNNWISFDQHGRLALFPMQAISRRDERRKDIVDFFNSNYNVIATNDLTRFEKEEKFLEGTGSMVIDYVNNIMYASLSPRTNKTVVDEFCRTMNYKPCTFTAVDQSGKEIYHTNVMMCIGEKLVVVCLDSIKNESEKNMLIGSFRSTGHEIIDISFNQMNHFAGNMLEVCNASGKKMLVMSAQALASLMDDQVSTIKKYDDILAPAVSTIEMIGGGGVRCMMAEVFLQKK